MLAADLMRFGGANQAVMWNAFAKRGYGEDAVSPTTESDQPTPGYSSPYLTEGTLAFTAHDFTVPSASPRPAVTGTLYLGDYSARITPVLDTDPATPLPNTLKLVPGTYSFVFQADGFGLRRFTATVKAGQTLNRDLHLSQNLASTANGATATGSAGSLNVSKLVDDERGHQLGRHGPGRAGRRHRRLGHPPVRHGGPRGRSADGAQRQRERPAPPDGQRAGRGPEHARRGLGQPLHRAAHVRRRDVHAEPDQRLQLPAAGRSARVPVQPDLHQRRRRVPGHAPRPLAPNLNLRSFDVPDTSATHVRLVALENQCTGTPGYQGEQDADPLNATDCDLDSDRGTEVRAAELQVFSFDASSRPPGDPRRRLDDDGPGDGAARGRAVLDDRLHQPGP